MKLIGSNKCPICGKEWAAEGNLVPNTKDRDFYGGRVKFFKEVICECKTKYTLCVEVKEDRQGKRTFPVIDMIVSADAETIKSIEEAEARKVKYDIIQKNGETYMTKEQKQEAKIQNVLATVIDKDTKIEKLLELTTNELRGIAKKRHVKFKVTESKQALAEKLLAADPSLVVAQQD